MSIACTTPRRCEPTDEEFVNAVIETHEQIRSSLRALLGEGIPADAGGASRDAQVIRAYCLAHGVDATAATGLRRSETRWLAV